MLPFIISGLEAPPGPEAPPGRDEHFLQAGLCLPYNLQRPSDLGLPASPPDSLCAPGLPHLPLCLLPSLGAPAINPLKATHRMWSTMDLPLLRNIYSVLFANCNSELFTEGLVRDRGYWGQIPS